jgi:hypothetical protein
MHPAKGAIMNRIALKAALISLLAAACASNGEYSVRSRYHISFSPKDFSANVTNRWFPLPPGRTLVYKGLKDGKKAVDYLVVSNEVHKIAGVPCRVVLDTTYLGGVLAETTRDFYTQDKHGNVWYFGEDTAEIAPDGTMISTEGSWHTGEAGAQPGIFMPANPKLGEAHIQEFFPGQAEDRFKVVDLSARVKVPYRQFAGALLTSETTPLEPDVLDHKYYVPGIGTVLETAVKGAPERFFLVDVRGGA